MKKRLVVAACLFGVLFLTVFGYRAFIMHRLRSEVLAGLNDPQSAQFQGERLFSDWTPGGSAMCGEVNAKNRMGGYVGFRPFVALPGYASVETEFGEQFKKKVGLPTCSFDKVAKWWHLKW
ncbi:hypothetical protein SAMN05216344_102162 [Polaromonas sp. OV174]|uniref:hypothetical protein n=1 Tax=Polaromonas sp. OV174 TaxID=1855300 RepID=UPI0008E2686C|nr:hypothetical protein [Polaromonas sp. OV174]SFB74040.1 hypothetical protein SAMN05216344_102162 [Polaromonas sp. OV174]